MASLSSVHTRTPALGVVDPRGLAVRQIAFFRTQTGDDVSTRINRSAYDTPGRLVRSWDPRLWLAATNDPASAANLNVIHFLTGQVLHSQHVDAGWSLELPGEAGQRHLRRDAQGYGQRAEYDQLLRPVAMFESDGVSERCLERLTYGGPDTGDANQCGQLIRHDDPAGSVINAEFGLKGAVVEQTRRFLKDLEPPDWPQALNERSEWLEPGEGAVTRSRFSATGEMIQQTDAIGAVRLFELTVGGQPSRSTLQFPDQAPQTLVRNIRYDAQARFESETAGNGHVTERTYDLADGRLRRQQVDNGRLQDLTYATDPVGNIVSIEDRAQPTRFFANQQIEPLRTFVYDTLYQLTEATGYEAASLNRGPQTAQRTLATADQLSNYTQRYEYDAGGNLQKLTHSGTQNHTRLFATAHFSNRSLLQTDERPPTQEQIAAGFDANGNLRQLAPGQALSWDLRNQLSEVTSVERETGVNDREVYQYDASGARVRKIRSMQAKSLSHSVEVRYLPGLEIRTNNVTGEVLQVITATAGHSTVRVLHWQTGKPTDIDNDHARYSLADHIGSSTLEVDQNGQLISQEVYYPYGETAWFAGRNDVEAKYKTVRYSGKERDATGLYYYGLRYYAPWLCRWLNPDPQGEEGGLNLYQMVMSNPIKYVDRQGLKPELPNEIHYIWIGQSDALRQHLPKIRDASTLNPGFRVTLHLDLKGADNGYQTIADELEDKRNVRVSKLREESFFKRFASSPSGQIYDELFADDSRNYAFATDVLRYSLINDYGGFYVDVDDAFQRGIRPEIFEMKKGRVFTMSTVEAPWGGYVINNNAFASHAQNPALGAVIKEVESRYQQGLAAELSAMPVENVSDIKKKMKRMSATTGPDVFTQVLTVHDPKLGKLHRAVVAQEVEKKAISDTKRFFKQEKKRMTMVHFIKPGSAHSWR